MTDVAGPAALAYEARLGVDKGLGLVGGHVHVDAQVIALLNGDAGRYFAREGPARVRLGP